MPNVSQETIDKLPKEGEKVSSERVEHITKSLAQKNAAEALRAQEQRQERRELEPEPEAEPEQPEQPEPEAKPAEKKSRFNLVTKFKKKASKAASKAASKIKQEGKKIDNRLSSAVRNSTERMQGRSNYKKDPSDNMPQEYNGGSTYVFNSTPLANKAPTESNLKAKQNQIKIFSNLQDAVVKASNKLGNEYFSNQKLHDNFNEILQIANKECDDLVDQFTENPKLNTEKALKEKNSLLKNLNKRVASVDKKVESYKKSLREIENYIFKENDIDIKAEDFDAVEALESLSQRYVIDIIHATKNAAKEPVKLEMLQLIKTVIDFLKISEEFAREQEGPKEVLKSNLEEFKENIENTQEAILNAKQEAATLTAERRAQKGGGITREQLLKGGLQMKTGLGDGNEESASIEDAGDTGRPLAPSQQTTPPAQTTGGPDKAPGIGGGAGNF